MSIQKTLDKKMEKIPTILPPKRERASSEKETLESSFKKATLQFLEYLKDDLEQNVYYCDTSSVSSSFGYIPECHSFNSGMFLDTPLEDDIYDFGNNNCELCNQKCSPFSQRCGVCFRNGYGIKI